MTTILKLFGWVLRRLLLGTLLSGLVLGAYALWLYAHDDMDFEVRRKEAATVLAGKRQQIETTMEEGRRRREQITLEIEAEEARVHQAEKVMATLHDLESTWDRFVGNPAQQKANAEQIKRMEDVRDRARAKQGELKQAFTRLIWERDGLELALGKIEEEATAVKEPTSAKEHYLGQAWQRLQWPIGILLVVYFFGLLAMAPRPRAE